MLHLPFWISHILIFKYLQIIIFILYLSSFSTCYSRGSPTCSHILHLSVSPRFGLPLRLHLHSHIIISQTFICSSSSFIFICVDSIIDFFHSLLSFYFMNKSFPKRNCGNCIRNRYSGSFYFDYRMTFLEHDFSSRIRAP